MEISEIRKNTGLSQSQFAKKYGIPVRTLQQWEQKKSSPPSYVISMLAKLVNQEMGRPRSILDIDPFDYNLPERNRWEVCINRPFLNCERIYPIQQQKVRELIDDFSRNRAVEKILIFGSSVTQRCHIGSDVDVYVELSAENDLVTDSHNFVFDLWTNFMVDERLQKEIFEKGVPVYERGTNTV